MPTEHDKQDQPGSAGRSPRMAALDVLCRVEAGAYADRLLDALRARRRLSAPDFALVQEMVRGSLTWQCAIDHRLRPYLSRPLRRQSPQIRNLQEAFRALLRSDLPLETALQTMAEMGDPLVDDLVAFVRASKRGFAHLPRTGDVLE